MTIRVSPTGVRVEERSGGLYYLGDDWAERLAEVGKTHGIKIVEVGDSVEVLIGYGSDPSDWAEWGKGQSVEEATRYALGAHCGSYDDEVTS